MLRMYWDRCLGWKWAAPKSDLRLCVTAFRGGRQLAGWPDPDRAGSDARVAVRRRTPPNLHHSVIDIRSANAIHLERGLIYVDLPDDGMTLGFAPSADLHVLTQAGMLERVGTAFEVLSTEQRVRVRVCEGWVRLRSAVSDVVAGAGTELLATPNGGVSRHAIATCGPEWQWVSALAPGYEIEGRPPLDFLLWVSRKLGRHLDFSDAHAAKSRGTRFSTGPCGAKLRLTRLRLVCQRLL